MRKSYIKVIALAALLCVCSEAKADDYMVVNTADSEVAEAIPDIVNIKFGETAMSITTLSGVVEVPYSQVQSIKFKSGPSGLQTLAGGKDMKVAYANSMLMISGTDRPVDMAVFSIAGALMMADPAYSGAAIDVSALPAGVYIAKINNTVVKFIK